MFVGTIINLLSGKLVSIEFISLFIHIFMVWLIAVLSFAISRIIARTSGNIKNFVLLLALLFVSCFTSPSAYFGYALFGRMEIFIILALVGVLFVLERPKWSFFVPVLCLISIAIHLVVLFFYIPVIVILLLYKIIKETNKKWWVIIFCTTILIILLAAIYFVFFSKYTLEYKIENEYFAYLSNKTNFVPERTAMASDFFWSIHDHFVYAKESYHSSDFVKHLWFIIIINIPIMLFFIYFWVSCISSEQNKGMKCIYLLSAVVPLISIPAFILFIDWGRWMILLLNSQFLLLFYFIYRKEESVLKMSGTITRNSCQIILACIFMIFLGPIQEVSLPANVTVLLSWLHLL
jgi:hypothetical protein